MSGSSRKYSWLLKDAGARLLAIILSGQVLAVQAVQQPLTQRLSIEQSIALAQHYDPWLQANAFHQQSLDNQRIAAGTLPDPRMTLGIANLPVDSVDFNQEAMTQFKVGVAQQFARGQSLTLRQKQLALLGAQQALLREDRKAKIAVTVAKLWLDAFLARESIRLIEQDRELFEHLVDVAQSSYSSTLGQTRQQDLVRAQLELTRLDDRLAVLGEKQDVALSQLQQWVRPGLAHQANSVSLLKSEKKAIALTKLLPTIELKQPEFFVHQAGLEQQILLSYLLVHPAIVHLDNKVRASDVGVELAKQKYKPQWGVNASYGYRDNDNFGNDRADFFSVGVTFDMPLFTSNRQDKEVQSAIADSEALKTEKSLALRNMLGVFEVARARLLRLNQRHSLYQTRLLEQMHEQAEASLSAYTNDDGDFSEAVRAHIALLNSQIDALAINIERLKTIVQLNYFFTQDDSNGDRSSSGRSS